MEVVASPEVEILKRAGFVLLGSEWYGKAYGVDTRDRLISAANSVGATPKSNFYKANKHSPSYWVISFTLWPFSVLVSEQPSKL